MTTTIRQSDGNLAIEQTESAVSTFESGFAKFLNNELLITTTMKINKITFEDLDLEQPKTFRLTLGTDAQLAGFSRIWRGAMFVGGTNTDVIAWRKD